MVVLLEIMEMSLAATTAVHDISDMDRRARTPEYIRSLIYSEYEIVRHAHTLLASLEKDRKAKLRQARDDEDESKAQAERERNQKVWDEIYADDRERWNRERDQWLASQAEWMKERARLLAHVANLEEAVQEADLPDHRRPPNWEESARSWQAAEAAAAEREADAPDHQADAQETV